MPRGRPRVLSAAQIHAARRMHAARVPISLIARLLGCGRATVRRALPRTEIADADRSETVA